MGKTTILFLPPSRYRTEETVWPTGGGGRGAGDLVHGDSREVGQNEEEVEGNSFRSSPWSGLRPGADRRRKIGEEKEGKRKRRKEKRKGRKEKGKRKIREEKKKSDLEK
jgi:hypothetical protein